MKHLDIIKDIRYSRVKYGENIKVLENFFETVVSKNKQENPTEMFMKLYEQDVKYPLIKY